jgi:glycosyltransferase involved in cell wall biosynthesis
MRILIANWSRNVSGGCEKYLQVLLPGLLARGHQVAMLYEQPVKLELETVDASGLGLQTWGVAELGLRTAMSSVEQWRPEVVYSHGLESGELEEALCRSFPTVLFAHNYYGTCGTGSKCHGFPEIRECTRHFGPMCLVLHYPRRCGGLNPRSAWRVYRRQAQRNAGLGQYRAILVASEHMYREYTAHVQDRARIRLVRLPMTDIVPNGAPPVRSVSQGRILMISRLTDVKGGQHLIEAAARAAQKLESLSLTIAGEGPERRKLEALAVRVGVDATFVGWVSGQQKIELLSQADLLAVPSLWPEPFGLIGIEAGCVGLPAVGFATGGIPDWLIPGHSGELAPADPPTVDGLAQAIVRALADPDHYARLRIGAWEVSKRFTLEEHLAKLEPILGAEESGSVASTTAHSALSPQIL